MPVPMAAEAAADMRAEVLLAVAAGMTSEVEVVGGTAGAVGVMEGAAGVPTVGTRTAAAEEHTATEEDMVVSPDVLLVCLCSGDDNVTPSG
jgi:hypothetical protein